MKAFRILFILPLLVGCAMEASEDMASEDTSVDSYEGSGGPWNLEPNVLPCLPYYYETHFNGQTFVISVPAICPPESPLDNILVDVDPIDERTNPADEFTNPVDEVVVPVYEDSFVKERELIH